MPFAIQHATLIHCIIHKGRFFQLQKRGMQFYFTAAIRIVVLLIRCQPNCKDAWEVKIVSEKHAHVITVNNNIKMTLQLYIQCPVSTSRAIKY